MKLVLKDGTELKCAELYYHQSAPSEVVSDDINYAIKFGRDDDPMKVVSNKDVYFSEENISSITFITDDGYNITLGFEKVSNIYFGATSTNVSLEITLKLKK